MKRRKIAKILREEVNGSFMLGGELGRGSFGVVYELKGMEQEAVLKVVSTDVFLARIEGGRNAEEFYYKRHVKYLRQEIESLKTMRECEYITRLIDSYEIMKHDSERIDYFLLIEEKYQCLDDFIKTQYLTEGLLIQMAKDILRAMTELEEKKILHRDIKPANIFIKWMNGKPRFILGDFGLSRKVDFQCKNVTAIGTRAFEAPEIDREEQIRGFNSDIFSLGASLFYILSEGRVPYIYFQSHTKPELKQGSEEFRRIILKAIERDPEKRYLHAKDMLRELDGLEGTCLDPIIFNRYAYLAKLALLEGKTADARRHAEKGVREGTDERQQMSKEALACLRILIYIQMKVEKDHELIREEDRLMLKKIADSGDAVAQYLYGVYLFDRHCVKESLTYFRRSADNGSEIGGYTYGRMLYKGFEEIPADMERGIAYMENAAGKGYVPALRHLSKILRKYPGSYVPEENIAELLEQDFADYKENKLMYIIPYL